MWIDDLSGQTTPVAYTGSKFVALPTLTPQPLIGHAEGVVAGSTCFGDRNPHTYGGTAAGLGQGVDEELLLRDFADEDQLMALSQEAMTVGWGGNGSEGAKTCLAQLQDSYKEVIAEASRIPAAERLAPRKKKEGAFDLTSSKVFLTSHPNMQKVVAAVRQVVGAQIGGEPAGVVVHRILLAFYRLYGFWRSKVYLSDAALAAAKEVQQTFAQEWKKTGWVPVTWVHWAACHSGVFLS